MSIFGGQLIDGCASLIAFFSSLAIDDCASPSLGLDADFLKYENNVLVFTSFDFGVLGVFGFDIFPVSASK